MPNPESVWSPAVPNNGLPNMKTLGDSLVMCTVGDLKLNRTPVGLRLVREESSSLRRDMCLGVSLVVYHQVQVSWT